MSTPSPRLDPTDIPGGCAIEIIRNQIVKAIGPGVLYRGRITVGTKPDRLRYKARVVMPDGHCYATYLLDDTISNVLSSGHASVRLVFFNEGYVRTTFAEGIFMWVMKKGSPALKAAMD